MNQNLVQEITQMHAELCGALADPTRLMILYTLSEGVRNVSELCGSLELSQPLVSRHLKILRERGLVQARRDGPAVLYTIADLRIIQALDLLRDVMASRLKNQAVLANTVNQISEPVSLT
jgi:ArsR family transcriptional regulator